MTFIRHVYGHCCKHCAQMTIYSVWVDTDTNREFSVITCLKCDAPTK